MRTISVSPDSFLYQADGWAVGIGGVLSLMHQNFRQKRPKDQTIKKGEFQHKHKEGKQRTYGRYLVRCLIIMGRVLGMSAVKRCSLVNHRTGPSNTGHGVNSKQ